MIKINPGTLVQILFVFVFFCFLPFAAKSQDTARHPWDIDPKSYVQNLATMASKEQILVQEEIKKSNIDIKELNARILNTSDTNLRKQLNDQLKTNKIDLSNHKINLKAKIEISKRYKSLVNQTPVQIKNYFNNEYLRTAKVVSPYSSPPLHSDPPVNTNSPKEIPNTNTSRAANSSLTSSDFNFEKWISKEIVKNDCAFQPVHEPSKNTALEPELLFAYTPEEIKKALRGISYIKGYAFVGKEPGYTFLQLNIEIASDLALQHYGNLHKSFMNIKLINGKEIRLINSRFDTGKSDPIKKTTSLSGMYYLDKEDEKSLSSSELDSIRLNFVSGYEDYVIYNVDFFTRQLACINAVK
ncbi:MAG: hypothetical protein ABI761_03760 [Saprospiraceae bacterium]